MERPHIGSPDVMQVKARVGKPAKQWVPRSSRGRDAGQRPRAASGGVAGSQTGSQGVMLPRQVRDESPAPRVRPGRDLLGRREEPVHGCGLARVRPRREADPANGLRQDQAGGPEPSSRRCTRIMNAGVGSSSTCTVREAVNDWLREGAGWHVRPARAHPGRGSNGQDLRLATRRWDARFVQARVVLTCLAWAVMGDPGDQSRAHVGDVL